VWMAKGRTLVSAPKVQASPADPTPAGLAAQLWFWTGCPGCSP
jgi:hypothetical protein